MNVDNNGDFVAPGADLRMLRKTRARAWATDIMQTKNNKGIVQPGDDTRRMETLLTQIYMMEDPSPTLSVGLHAHGENYIVSVSGFRRPRDIGTWYETFLDRQRREEDIQTVLGIQESDGASGTVYAFKVEKMVMDVAPPSAKKHPAIVTPLPSYRGPAALSTPGRQQHMLPSSASRLRKPVADAHYSVRK